VEKAHKKTILLVDDDPLVRSAMKMAISDDYNVLEAEDGYQGLEVLRNHVSEIQCVVTDIRMPGLNGSEYMAKAGEVTQDVYFVIVTGHKGEVTESKLISDGSGRLSGFLEKPISNDELKYQIQKAVELTQIQQDRARANYNAQQLVEAVETIYAATNEDELLQLIIDNVSRFMSVKTAFWALADSRNNLLIRGGSDRFSGLIGDPIEGNPNLRSADVEAVRKAIEEDTVTENEHIMALPLYNGVILLFGNPLIDARDKNFIRTYVRNAEQALERMHLYEKLKDANTKLTQLDKMKTKFTDIISHELRTPLASMKGYLFLLDVQARPKLDEETTQSLEIINNCTNKLVAIANDVTNLSRLTSAEIKLRLTTINLAQLFQDIQKEVELFIKYRNQVFQTHIEEGLVNIVGDQEGISQAIKNLIMNAIKFTPDGGTISLKARQTTSTYEIQVSDTGIGIPESEFENIFSGFYEVGDTSYHHSGTFEFKAGGLGLGLRIVKSIVSAHGGDVRVESELEKGSTFTLLLPKTITPAAT